MSPVNAANLLRVSVASYNRVTFPHPQNGASMLALERKANISKDGSVNVHAQPFGGGVRILAPISLKEMLGKIEFDSERSKHEQDFRILIPPAKWESVKQYCLEHLANPNDPEIESTPDRELIEEFEETLHADLKPDQYTTEPLGLVVENNPVWTENWYAREYPTVRVYGVHKVQIIDTALCEFMLDAGRKHSEQELGSLALKNLQQGGRGRSNSILTLPLDTVTDAYRALSPDMRYRRITVKDHTLDESVSVVLGDVEVPQYQRMY